MVALGYSRNVRNGFADYNDAATATTPITLVGGVWTTLTNDGLGSFTNEGYLPTGVTSMMNTPAGTLDFSELDLGDTVVIRADFTVTPDTNNQDIDYRLMLGAGINAYTLEETEAKMDRGGSQPYRFALFAKFVYLGDANTRDNPVTTQLRTSGSGSVVNSGIAIGVTKR